MGREGKRFFQFGVELFMVFCIVCLLFVFGTVTECGFVLLACLSLSLLMSYMYSYQGVCQSILLILRCSYPASQRLREV